jgi:RNA-directed DNA polymerase
VFPSAKAQARAREKLRELTDHRRCSVPIPEIIDEVNRWQRGWGNYFRHGHPGRVFASLNGFVQNRMRRHLKRRSQRHLRPPEGVSFYAYLQRLGLQRLRATRG